MAKHTSTAIDVYVGRRIRMRRNTLKLSRITLGRAIGVTFQQIQKYEKGESRVGGERLQAIAVALKVPVNFFFDAAPGSERIPTWVAPDFIDKFLADRRGIELARHFVNITDTAARDAILVLVKMFTK
jgi:transcriptional regulator with XRE-family HTH domain